MPGNCGLQYGQGLDKDPQNPKPTAIHPERDQGLHEISHVPVMHSFE